MKTKFYIFLDIDGVLYDWEFILQKANKGEIKKGIIKDFKPESIKALNLLIKELSQVYDVQVVITSAWRYNMRRTIETLNSQGVLYSGKYDKTQLGDPCMRGEQILEYLKDKPKGYRFVIIDDEMFNFNKYFSNDKIIKTNISNNALSIEQVVNFLSNEIENIK